MRHMVLSAIRIAQLWEQGTTAAAAAWKLLVQSARPVHAQDQYRDGHVLRS